MSRSYTQNIKSVITAHNKKLLSENKNTVLPCNCRVKNKCPVNGECRTRNILYKYVASTSMKPNKVFLVTTEWGFKRFYKHKNCSTTGLRPMTLSKYSPNTLQIRLGHRIKMHQNSGLEMVHWKGSSIAFNF